MYARNRLLSGNHPSYVGGVAGTYQAIPFPVYAKNRFYQAIPSLVQVGNELFIKQILFYECEKQAFIKQYHFLCM